MVNYAFLQLHGGNALYVIMSVANAHEGDAIYLDNIVTGVLQRILCVIQCYLCRLHAIIACVAIPAHRHRGSFFASVCVNIVVLFYNINSVNHIFSLNRGAIGLKLI